MVTHTVGRESQILSEIKSGQKTVEARLAKPRFKKFAVGDHIKIREDVWKNDEIIQSSDSGVETEIIKIETYPAFRKMLEAVGFSKISPRAKSLNDALAEIYQFYNPADEQKLGVLAIHFRLIRAL